ncbi:hypothetical protein DFP73DRAFT_525101 [Morchella snyderi]|nr:hypothetical protein DFP73DRAFT_525101 [Morchella snyderi]
MTELTTEKPTASHPTGVTPSTATTTTSTTSTAEEAPTRTTPLAPEPPLQPTPIPAPGIHGALFHGETGRHSPTPAIPQPGAIPFLPKETAAPGTGPSSRCSSVNPNDTLPPTPNCGPAEPYPPQMRLRENMAPTRSTLPLPPGARMQGEQEVRPTTHLPVDDHIGRPATMNIAVPTEYHNALLSRPVQEPSYTAARRSAEVHPSGYKQNSEAMEKPRYYGVQNENENKNENEKDGRGDGNGEETLLGKLGKWMEGLNNKIVETGITGDTKGKGKESHSILLLVLFPFDKLHWYN